ncbi:hypothetical protein C5167_003345 [Papaver somniferum]|uniref:F-box domain-containing protein n=1 Tax=Papaver somniferum TaxID=3469 RepID=A0A4Y7L2D3_PAPSO|nr:F-box/WD-40 repeat-containing protein At5g21040-like [Papaver somniferum]RZC79127.1 hypothetical protein C5167_003345 [Papaver somniferum]
MAFECHRETGNLSSNLVDCVQDPWDEEVAPVQFPTYDELKKGDSNSNSGKEEAQIVPVSNSDSGSQNQALVRAADNSISDHCPIIIDLPAALVSEILLWLDAKELGIISCVSTLLQKLAADHQGWKNFYAERWGLPLGPISLDSATVQKEKSWKDLFVDREFRSNAFMGRFSTDVLYGHTEAVRSVFLLSSANIILTAGYDCIIRIWGVEDGLLISSSRPLGCTIRAVTADADLLVAGGTDGFLQCWKAVEGLRHLFDITGSQNQSSEFRLWEHVGPVTCVALDEARIYSGSWDMTVRVWDRSLMKCLKVLRHSDWVWSLVPRGGTVASTAGAVVYVWDIDTGDLDAVIQNPHVGDTCSLARNQTGDVFFTGGEDGGIKMFEMKNDGEEKRFDQIAYWGQHSSKVHSLAFEFPWLVSASSDGKVSLRDVRKLFRSSKARKFSKAKPKAAASQGMEVPRMLHGFKRNIFSVDIGADRIVCGGEEGIVRVWNFSQALEIDRRVQALRSVRLENRMRRKEAQIEMNNKGARNAHCSSKKNQINGNGSGVLYSRGGASAKLKA